jgi:acyl carrier protein
MNSLAPSRDTIVQELTSLFHDVFDDDGIVLSDTMTAKDVERWDSLNHINLIVAIEQRFHVKFSTAEVARMANVGELVDTLVGKLTR